MPKIVFTGGGSAGHVTPNVALISRLQKQGWDIHYIGSASGIERELVAETGVPFYPIASGKLRRYFDLQNFKDPLNVLKGVGQSYSLLRKLKPDVVFSKGGFVAVPVVVASWLNRIPVIIHESDMTPGLANRLSLRFAGNVCVTFPETMRYVAQSKAVCTGLPIREEILHGRADQGYRFCDFYKGKPVLFIMGGSLGSAAINQAVRDRLDELRGHFQIVHLCGKGHVDASLSDKGGYRQYEYIGKELPDLLAMADVVVSRAGSTSIFEYLSLRKPMLLIPLSRQSSRGDQILNADSFAQQGYARVLPEEQLSGAGLLDAVSSLYADRKTYAAAMAGQASADAAERIVRLLEQTANRRK